VRIGPFHVTRLHRHRVERRYELPWDVLTSEHLSAEARALIARVARSAAKDALGELLADDDASYLITRSVYERAMNEINAHLSRLGATTLEHSDEEPDSRTRGDRG